MAPKLKHNRQTRSTEHPIGKSIKANQCIDFSALFPLNDAATGLVRSY